jgi:hypothetical protein
MQTDVINRTVVVDAMGEAALDLLCRGGHWKVLASVSQAVYLINEQEEILWQTASTIPLHRRGLQVRGPMPHPMVGMVYQVKEGILMPVSDGEINFSGSAIWKTPPLPAEDVVPIPTLSGLLLDTYHYFLDWPKPACLAGLIPSISKLLSQRGHQDSPQTAPEDLEYYWPSITGLIRATLVFDFDLLIENAAQLVGLGPGLTPSGDDFLGGFFFGLQALSRTYPDLSILKTWNYSDFIMKSKAGTHIISHTLLKDHAAGFALEPLHSFANSLFTGQPVEKNLQNAIKLVTVGHSTGWDLLTGFLAGLSVAFA